MSILFLNILTLLVCTQSVDKLFHTLMFLCENEYFLTSNLLERCRERGRERVRERGRYREREMERERERERDRERER